MKARDGRRALLRSVIIGVAALAIPACIVMFSISMPGRSHSSPCPPLGPEDEERALRLREHVAVLSRDIGERHVFAPRTLESAARYIEKTLGSIGYSPAAMVFVSGGERVRNIEVGIQGAGRADEIIVLGAHYDTVPGTPGADDNASGVAVALELAQMLKDTHPRRTVRIVFFANEEPPHFQTSDMGSYQYAMRSKERGEHIAGMLSIESVGYYQDEPGTQTYPFPLSLFYPDRGNFIAFVGNYSSRTLLHDAIAAFREAEAFPSEGLAAPAALTGVDWSDHWSFWEAGYQAIMVTDTALFRNHFYHTAGDVAGRLDYSRMSRVARGLGAVANTLAN